MKFALTLFGIWPSTSYVLIKVYWIISLTTDQIGHYRYFRAHLQAENLPILVDCLSTFIAHTKVITKLLTFWFNQQKFVKVLTMMTEDWSECADNEDDMRKTVCKAKTSDRITNVMFILHVVNVLVFSMTVFTADVDIESELPFFLKVQLPVRISTIRTYRLLLSAQFVHLMFVVIGTGLVNSLLLTLILHVGGQIDILRSWLTELVSKESEGTHESIVIMMSKIIRKHQRIIQFSRYIENLYTYIAFMVVASNSVMICMLVCQVIIALGSPNATEYISRSILFYIITNLESFIFCFAGEYLKNKSKMIGIAAYNSAWYDLMPQDSRVLLFVILRAQSQLTLTAGKMMDLSLDSFANIMKASASYMSVLLAMQ